MLEPALTPPTASIAALPAGALRGLDLSGWSLAGLDLQGRDLCRADLSAADLRGADLRDARLSATRLRRACLVELRGAGLSGRDLDAEGADLTGADLQRADLRSAILLEACLAQARLGGADLRGADLRSADLRGADLRLALLDGADLDGARLDGAWLEGARARGAHALHITDEAARAQLAAAGAVDQPLHQRARFALSRPAQLGQQGADAALRASRQLGQWAQRARERLAALSAPKAGEETAAERRGRAEQERKARLEDWTSARREADEQRRQERGFRAARAQAQEAEATARRNRRVGRFVALEPAPALPPRPAAVDPQALLLARRVALRETLALRPFPAPTPFAAGPTRPAPAAPPAVEVALPAPPAVEALEPGPPPVDAPPMGERLAAFAARFKPRPRPTWEQPHQTEDGALDLRGARLGEVDASGQDLRRARLDGLDLSAVRLSRAQLAGASLHRSRAEGGQLDEIEAEGALMEGVRLRKASLAGARLMGARLIDADLREADLSRADLTGADLTGADLRGARLDRTSLYGANLTACRLADTPLPDTVLDKAQLDQADLAGVDWSSASVVEADLSGALGVSNRERAELGARGAKVGGAGLEELLGKLAPRQLRAALAVLGLGAGAWLLARYLGAPDANLARREAAAEQLRGADPAAASEAFSALAKEAARLDDKVGYLTEAAELAALAGQTTVAIALYETALGEAGDEGMLGAGVRVKLATFHSEAGRWTEARQVIAPLLQAEGLGADLRARAVLLVEAANEALGVEADTELAALYQSLAGLPDVEADLRLATAELRSARGDHSGALAELEKAAPLALGEEQTARILGAKARVLGRSGDLDGAAAAYEALLLRSPPPSVTAQAALLSLADVRGRQGRSEEAAAALATLLAIPALDVQVHGRVLLLTGQQAENDGDIVLAAGRFREALGLPGLDPETLDEARLSLARVLLQGGETEAAQEALAGLDPEAAGAVLFHAGLGEARALLDDNQAEAALERYEALLATDPADRQLSAAARSGRAECLSRLGRVPEAVTLWRALLGELEASQTAERANIELSLAQGLLQGSQIEEAKAAYRALSLNSDADIRFQGLLGLGEVALAAGERARARDQFQQVADQAPDVALQVQALEELAQMAQEDGRPAEALVAWRSLVGRLPASHPAAALARVQLLSALLAAGALPEAAALCESAVEQASNPADRAAADIVCAEIVERTGDLGAAALRLDRLMTDPELPRDLRPDVAIALSRVRLTQGQAAAAAAAARAGLDGERDPAARAPLLSALVAALEADPQADPADLARALADRDALAVESPDLAGPVLQDAAGRALAAGRPDEAVSLLQRAAALPIPDEDRLPILLELAGALREIGDAKGATAPLDEAIRLAGTLKDPHAAYLAALARAELDQANGALAAARSRLGALQPPDAEARIRWLELRAGLALEAGDGAGALQLFEELGAEAAGDAGVLASALRGQGDALLALGKPAEALSRYDRVAVGDPGLSGWVSLSAAQALLALERPDEARARLQALASSPDREVALQARIGASDLLIEADKAGEALALLRGASATGMGGAWSATLGEARARALAATGDRDGATAELQGLLRTFPSDPEARLPALLGLSTLAEQGGDKEAALRFARQALQEAADPGYREAAQSRIAALD